MIDLIGASKSLSKFREKWKQQNPEKNVYKSPADNELQKQTNAQRKKICQDLVDTSKSPFELVEFNLREEYEQNYPGKNV